MLGVSVRPVTSRYEQPVVDYYLRNWLKAYGGLSMIAPKRVMDAFDDLNRYSVTLGGLHQH